jgi:hypothetical protein
MRHVKTSFTISGVSLTLWIILLALFLSAKSSAGLVMAGVSFMFFSYEVYRLYRKLLLYNWGRPLSVERKRKIEQFRRQYGDYQRSNLYHVWYRFADATEQEYLAEKFQESLKRVRRR